MISTIIAKTIEAQLNWEEFLLPTYEGFLTTYVVPTPLNLTLPTLIPYTPPVLTPFNLPTPYVLPEFPQIPIPTPIPLPSWLD